MTTRTLLHSHTHACTLCGVRIPRLHTRTQLTHTRTHSAMFTFHDHRQMRKEDREEKAELPVRFGLRNQSPRELYDLYFHVSQVGS